MESPATTPMLQQYHEIKSKHKDCILFFRLGDFYEMFYEDARIASGVLDLVLTSRGHAKTGKVPMCGIPYHAADGYIAKLIKAGFKVAVCEQTEDPAQAAGSIVRRDVIRVITSGTFLDDSTAESRYLLALTPNGNATGFAFTDSVDGTIRTNECTDAAKIVEIIAKLPVCECIFPETARQKIDAIFRHPLLKMKNIALSPYEDWCFNKDIAKKTLCDHFTIHNLSGFGIEDLFLAQSSAGALLEYLRQMNKQPLKHIDKISLYSDDDHVFISPAACRGLELEDLRKTLDGTSTPMGGREFRFWLYHPLKKKEVIYQRQEAVTLLKNNPEILATLSAGARHGAPLLRNMPDIEKSVSRLSCGYASAKDILAVRNALARLPEIKSTVSPLAVRNPLFVVEDIEDLRVLLEKAVDPDVPLSHSDGKVILKGYNKELDELRDIQDNGRKWLQELQAKESKRIGINSLKIGFNKVFGYYIEITKTHLESVPGDYIRKQTLVNAERFITPELKEFEEKILHAEERIIKLENELLRDIQKRILDHSAAIHAFSESIATIDVLASLARLALSSNYVCPIIDEGTVIDIKEGRHPVVEKISTESFVPNDTFLDCETSHLIILTGPNMAGKSTYIRQIALLVIMAQMGSYLPAASAQIGIVDKIFTRIGAHDDISKGQSTFMVEMSEAADILNNMTERSLIILDEIGRGTSTYDGLSLAWAIAEHLKDRKARTLFATHFHELTALADPDNPVGAGDHSGVKNYNVAVKEWKDEIVFLHKIVPGSTDDSYGIYVAKLAGIPKDVIARSQRILTQLELQSNLKDKVRNQLSGEAQLNLFEGREDPVMKEIKADLEKLDINTMTPLEAMAKLEKLKKIVKNK